MDNQIMDKETLNALASEAYKEGYIQGALDANNKLADAIQTAFKHGQMFENDACAKLFPSSEISDLIRQRINHEIA